MGLDYKEIEIVFVTVDHTLTMQTVDLERFEAKRKNSVFELLILVRKKQTQATLGWETNKNIHHNKDNRPKHHCRDKTCFFTLLLFFDRHPQKCHLSHHVRDVRE